MTEQGVARNKRDKHKLQHGQESSTPKEHVKNIKEKRKSLEVNDSFFLFFILIK